MLSGAPSARNIELKARCPDLAAAEHTARDLGATYHASERQQDTYFRSADGRLKLRQRWVENRPLPSELIWYRRSDEPRPRPSDYSLVPVANGAEMRVVLAGALGIVTEVVKQRTVYLHDNVRIHLDDVANLGTFLEFEAIVDGTCDEAAALAKLERLRVAFAVAPEHVLSSSYADLLRR